ncbi:hypothetical protein SH591_00315 [Sphingomonas sp. LY54]|uniref:hypothetical protein n=1 Tax=Sphingomonas sp. LY54 TaxID=3095343 RepID=UPI002D76D761|nr:hypothetical protein [Sphingomonas sp. LY54]WRP28669.1 hypothetical protein SH591_00315 [Sphingomonas sp. LY54]
MIEGAERAQAQAETGIAPDPQDWDAVAAESEAVSAEIWEPEEAVDESRGGRLLAALLILLALAWVGAATWSIVRGGMPKDLPSLVQAIALASGPLILLGLVWLIFGRSTRRETERFTQAVAAMRQESLALENVLAIVATRLEENHTKLTSEAAKLMALGDEASDRLGRVTHYLAKESAVLDKRSQALESAAEAARVDIGVMLQDLPRAEEQARSLAGALRETGLTAHEQAGQLDGQLSSLIARGREADEVVGGAAQRLAAHLARIESSSAAAATRMDEAAAAMTAAIDGTMARAAEAVDATRSGVEEQAAAVLALIEQSRATFERAGDETARGLAVRLEEIGTRIEDLTGKLGAQDAASQALVERLGRELGELDEQLVALGESGRGNSEMLGNSLQVLRSAAESLFQELGKGEERAGTMIDRTHELAHELTAVGGRLTEVEQQAGRAGAAADGVAPRVESLRTSADAAAATLAAAETNVQRQQEAVEALLGIVNDGVRTAEERLLSLADALGRADEATAKIVGDTGPELVDALVRVRETANQAAERAREAISAVIPQSAAMLAEASRLAVGEAISGQVVEQMGELSLVAERAVETARRASERLTRQMLTIGEAAAAIEERIDEGRREREQSDSDNFSRRVALLMESLNSTAIDVTKILSNEVTDSAWAAYLKGDRGVFTRRAVRLLDATETREIVQHYEAEPEFRDQVNRYIHDFEAMLRRVLADREGATLGVTLLSSDMGKIYVALAQAIERLRA